MNDTNRSPFWKSLAELEARHEVKVAKLSLLKADPTYRRVDADTLHETYTCAAETGAAIRNMIRAVCARFEIVPADIGYCLDP